MFELAVCRGFLLFLSHCNTFSVCYIIISVFSLIVQKQIVNVGTVHVMQFLSVCFDVQVSVLVILLPGLSRLVMCFKSCQLHFISIKTRLLKFQAHSRLRCSCIYVFCLRYRLVSSCNCLLLTKWELFHVCWIVTAILFFFTSKFYICAWDFIFFLNFVASLLLLYFQSAIKSKRV